MTYKVTYFDLMTIFLIYIVLKSWPNSFVYEKDANTFSPHCRKLRCYANARYMVLTGISKPQLVYSIKKIQCTATLGNNSYRGEGVTYHSKNMHNFRKPFCLFFFTCIYNSTVLTKHLCMSLLIIIKITLHLC